MICETGLKSAKDAGRKLLPNRFPPEHGKRVRSTRISKGARREIAVDSDNSCVRLKQTTALLVCYYYFIILLVTLNTYKVYL